jgi:VWFA-related protein
MCPSLDWRIGPVLSVLSNHGSAVSWSSSRPSFVESVYSTLRFGGDEPPVRRFYGSTLIGFLALLAQAPAQIGTNGISASAPSPTEQPGLRQELPSEAVSIEGLVRLDVVVSDQGGKAVEGLKWADFKVVENGVTQSVVAFRNPNDAAAGSDESLRIILLLDTLDLPGSLEQQMREHAAEYLPDLEQQERQQAADFLRRNAGKLAHPVTIYSLKKTGFFLTAGPSLDGELLARAVIADDKAQTYFVPPPDLCKPADNEFRLIPAMTGLRALGTIATQEVSRPGRKLLLWIGPGLKAGGTGAFAVDGQSLLTQSPSGCSHPPYSPFTYTLSGHPGQERRLDLFKKIIWFSALLRQARVTLDSLAETVPRSPGQAPGLEESPSEWEQFLSGASSLQPASWMYLYKKVLAIQSGGRVLPFAEDRVRQIEDAIDAEKNYYSLTFEPLPARTEEYHLLKVEVSQPNLTARTTTGYYDEPYYEDPPNPTIQHVTVAQLQTIVLSFTHGISPWQGMALSKQAIPGRIQRLELTERVSPTALQQLLRLTGWHGDAHSLDELAHQSAFLEPPGSEILRDPTPKEAEQQRILSAAADYLGTIVPKLPDLFAMRSAVYYRGAPAQDVTQSKETVVYRHGDEEIVDDKMQHIPGSNQPLKSYGSFGPILNSLQVLFADHAGFTWKRWEKSATGRLAIFAYESPGTPRVTLSGCCFPNDAGRGRMALSTASHVEVAIDPRSGAILRVQVQDILGGFVPIRRSDLMVSYGPVDIQGKTFIVPVYSVSIERGRSISITPAQWNSLTFAGWGPYETRMSVFTFDNYHNFRSEVRILPN